MKKSCISVMIFVFALLMLATGCASNAGSSGKRVACPSCSKSVSGLVTKKDAAGVSRTWCSSCWTDYDSIMDR